MTRSLRNCAKVASAPVAQSEEQGPFKPWVPRSKLGGGTKQLPLNMQSKAALEPALAVAA